MMTMGFVFLFYFGEQLLNIILIRLSYFTPQISGFSLGSIIWSIEIFIIALLVISSKVILKRDIAFILMICVVGAGVNLNVASRIFVVSIFYLFALKLHANARA